MMLREGGKKTFLLIEDKVVKMKGGKGGNENQMIIDYILGRFDELDKEMSEY